MEEPEKHSRLGIASFVTSLAVCVLMLGTIVAAGVLVQQRQGPGHPYPGQTVIGGVIILLLIADMVAGCLGIASLFEKGRKRIFGVLGVIFSGVVLLATVGLFVIGLLAYMRRGM